MEKWNICAKVGFLLNNSNYLTFYTSSCCELYAIMYYIQHVYIKPFNTHMMKRKPKRRLQRLHLLCRQTCSHSIILEEQEKALPSNDATSSREKISFLLSTSPARISSTFVLHLREKTPIKGMPIKGISA